MNTEPGLSVKSIVAALGAFVIVAPLVLIALMWADKLVPAIKVRMAKKAAVAPLVRKAAALGLTYESVKAEPLKAVGQPAVWCLRRIVPQGAVSGLAGPVPETVVASVGGFAETLYDGQEGRSVYISNPEKMYQMAGSSHQNCLKTLVTIKGVVSTDFGGNARGLRIEAEFVEYP